jgi:hypothetical protein
MARRHIRLCGQFKDTAKYGQAMQSKLTALDEKEQERKAAEDLCEDALDDLTLKDATLDNAVHNLYDYVNIYDRENLMQYVTVLFPTHRFTDITNLSAAKEPLEVARLIEKLQNFGETELVTSYVYTLTTAMNDVNAALEARRVATENLRRKQGLEELARNDVRMQYELNYLEARKDLGKQKAELLFPKVNRRALKPKSDAEESILNE